MHKSFYITTPIYYVNDKPHIGHAYTTVLADVLARYHRLLGYQTFFLTGTDEHGQKVQQAALKQGITPEAQVEECHLRFKSLWQELNISYDRFIRTTEESHVRFVQQSLQQLYECGDIYSKTYSGWYSVGEETFFADEELVDGKDPISHRPVEWLEEKNYFFQMSRYQRQLLEHIKANPDFIQPDFRCNEVLGFLQAPLRDLCISRPRSRLNWGIPLPFDNDFVTYVWFDALLNYQSAVQDRYFSDDNSLWPADCHLIGKDILITHAVYWPTMLMALDRPLPRHIFAHGWWLTQGEKLSKSAGNAINPLDFLDKYNVDAIRYFLMRSMTLGQDSVFTEELLIQRINTELANDLGNALNRIHKFIHKQFSARIPIPGLPQQQEEKLAALAQQAMDAVKQLLPQLKLSQLLEQISKLTGEINRYIDHNAPWQLARSEQQLQDHSQLATILYYSCEALRTVLTLLFPIMPQKCQQGLQMLGLEQAPNKESLSWGVLQGAERLKPSQALFPRIDPRV